MMSGVFDFTNLFPQQFTQAKAAPMLAVASQAELPAPVLWLQDHASHGG
jgi:hypothetical protein